MHVVLLQRGAVSLVRLRAIWMTNQYRPSSVLWHCWLDCQICKGRNPHRRTSWKL